MDLYRTLKCRVFGAPKAYGIGLQDQCRLYVHEIFWQQEAPGYYANAISLFFKVQGLSGLGFKV